MYNPETYKPRFIDSIIEKHMQVAAAIYISGPKWVGKTTSAERYCINHNGSKVCFDDSQNGYETRALAKINPELVLDGALPRLIDEWQECPALWDKIRVKADATDKVGMYALTGSFVDYDSYTHSGAGRIKEILMDSMTLYESGESTGAVSISSLFDKDPDKPFEAISTGSVNLEDIIRYIIRGGWPEAIDKPIEAVGIMPKGYMDAIDKDVIALLHAKNKRNREKMDSTLTVLAKNDTNVVLYSKILESINKSLEVSISKNTMYDYLDAFEKLNIIVDQKPIIPEFDSSRNVLKTSKHRYTDPSLICAQLNISRATLLEDSALRNQLFDNLAYHDLRVYVETAIGGSVYHYADSYGLMIDNVVKMPNGHYGAFMNVLTTDRIDQASEKLLRYKKILNGTELEPDVLCVISGLSNAAYQREDGVFVVPLTSLKP